MFSELEKYKNKGHFFFKKGDSLKEISKSVPNLPGVYIIYRLCRSRIELIYIGKSGTFCSNGKFKEQLGKHLNTKHEGLSRQKFFEEKLKEEGSDALDINWYVTFDEINQNLPSYVEGLLLQQFFNIYGRLPEWNKEY